MKLFETAIKSRFEKAIAKVDQKKCKRIFDYPWEVLKNVSILKVIYTELKDTNAYLALCEKNGTNSPIISYLLLANSLKTSAIILPTRQPKALQKRMDRLQRQYTAP